MLKENHLILIQEHWLFQCQTYLIGEIDSNICYVAKGVDINNPIQPTQLPRGYGGVAVLWNKNIDSYVKPLPDGNERLQCIEFGQQSGVKLLIISAYFPTSSGKECKMEFQDIIDQLHEIYQKYHETHEIIIGGDLNEDLSNQNCSSKRREYLRNFISECNLKYCISGKTFTNSSGRECSEIDYFLTQTRSKLGTVKKYIIQTIDSNTSDHKPICISLSYNVQVDTTQDKKNDKSGKYSKVNWKKTDKDYYRTLVSQRLAEIKLNDSSADDQNDNNFLNFCEILTESAKECTKSSKAKASKPKLKVWTPEISSALKDLRLAHKIWKQNGSPNDVNNEFLKHKKLCKQNFRRHIRIEQGKRLKDEKEQIMNARTHDSKLFHKLVQKQRKHGQSYINELHVRDGLYSGNESILQGFKKTL